MCSKLKLFFTVYTLKATGNGMESGGCQVFNNVLGEESLEFFFLQQNTKFKYTAETKQLATMTKMKKKNDKKEKERR